MNEIPNIVKLSSGDDEIFKYRCSSSEEFLKAFKQLFPVVEDCERVLLADDSPREASFGILVIDFSKEKSTEIKYAISYQLHIKHAREIPLIFEMHLKVTSVYEEYFSKINNYLESLPNES